MLKRKRTIHKNAHKSVHPKIDIRGRATEQANNDIYTNN